MSFIVKGDDYIKLSIADSSNTLQECIDKANKCLDEAYLEILESANDFNNTLDEKTTKYAILKEKIVSAINHKVRIDTYIEEIYNEDLIANGALKELIIEEISKSIPKSSIKIARVIKSCKESLKTHKNGKLLLNKIQAEMCAKIKEYNELTVNGIINDNWHLDSYIDTRNDLIDYISKIEYDIEIETEEINNKEVKKIKFKQRLRVTYDELQRFAKHMGYEEVRQGNTTHRVWRHTSTGLSNPIPNKSGTVPQGTVSRILKQMELNRADLAQFLYGK